MECRTLVNLLDEFNEQNIIATLNLKPEKTIFIYENNTENIKQFKAIKTYLQDKLPEIQIEGNAVEMVNIQHIEKLISSFNRENTVINLSCGSKLMSLLTYKTAEKYKITCIFIDISSEVILNLSDDKTDKFNIELQELKVNDFIKSTGGKILSDSTEIFDNSKVLEFLDYIIDNYSSWTKLKNNLRNDDIAKHDKFYMDKVIIDKEKIDDEYRPIYVKFLEKAKNLNLVSTSNSKNNNLIVQFNNEGMKTLFFKTGTWLEVLVYKTLKQINEVDDVKIGVTFKWNDNKQYVKNEIDVLASINSQLICISCKDTDKYDEDALNELEVYSDMLGGDDVKKVLTASKESYKKSTILRAKEMGIDIVVFNGNVKTLKESLRNILKI
ncbi:DUF1887 family CARF protein [Clostridium aestuarii]|uniref:DUF1887 family CARF protein n=1 Tax=Clostridium aestuarii TaxID=338193 RepID=A0ABT4D2E1_9CLOT|nr:DUF1887 family CARF protein [Clostridium aestuarii]MCY6484807.1 DUF1887 family CARF protein [Clostridium aestuarii]